MTLQPSSLMAYKTPTFFIKRSLKFTLTSPNFDTVILNANRVEILNIIKFSIMIGLLLCERKERFFVGLLLNRFSFWLFQMKFNFYHTCKAVYVSDTHLPSKIDLYVLESEKVLLKYAYDNRGLYYMMIN